MEQVTKLIQEASELRGLADRSEMQPIRDQLLGLAMRCQCLAKWLEENWPAADLREDAFPPDLH